MTKIAAVMLAFAMGERLSSIIADKDDVRNVAGLRDEHGHMSEGEHGQTPTWPLLGMGGHCAENGNRPQVCFTSAGAPVASQATCEQDCASLSACVAYEYGPNSGVVYCQLVIPTPVGQTASCPSGFTWGWGHQDGQSVNGIQAHAHMPQTGCYTRPSSSSSGSSGPSMSNHLDITTATRDACVSGKVAGRTALTDGAACSAETNVTCATKYEQKSRSTHRVGQDGSTDYSGSYDLVGELHLCEWRPELDRCEAGKVLTVCPEGDHVVEVSAGAGASLSIDYSRTVTGTYLTAYKRLGQVTDGFVNTPETETGALECLALAAADPECYSPPDGATFISLGGPWCDCPQAANGHNCNFSDCSPVSAGGTGGGCGLTQGGGCNAQYNGASSFNIVYAGSTGR